MIDLQHTYPRISKLKQQLGEELKSALFLAAYFATWFCAMVFLGLTTLDGWPIFWRHLGLP